MKYSKDMCAKAEQVLSDGESLAGVCVELNVTRTTLYEWRDSHPEFKDAIDRGLQQSQKVWEQIGRDGIVGNYAKFAVAAWIFTMKNRFRIDYKEDKEEKSESAAIIEKLIDKLAE